MRSPRGSLWSLFGLLTLLAAAVPVTAADGDQELPRPRPLQPDPLTYLPRYALDVTMHLDEHFVTVHQRVTWKNRHQRPTNELVFNVHSHYKVPEDQIGFLAKMVEILRLSPAEALETEGHACQVQKIHLVDGPGVELAFHYQEENDTALVVTLPAPINQGDEITLDLDITMRLPNKQGRWGQWEGVTFLTNWLPVLAFYDDQGWQPTPYIPWHQPFFNEAGLYSARITLPCNQKLACTAQVKEEKDLGNGLRQLDMVPTIGRDFALLCSARYREYTGQAGHVTIRCLAFPEHEYYAREMLRVACETFPVYNQWFGAYPFAQFTIAESYFGWNGNECASLVMIDERVFNMPHAAGGFVEYLLAHEICHQWWYNVVGTNGYCETWMDEGLATYFSHRLMNKKHGKNNNLLSLPRGLEWLPNIERETYRYYGMYGTLRRGEMGPALQELPKFDHVINLFSVCYDRGNKIVGLIEDRLGEAAFFDFMRQTYTRYRFGILRVADFQRDLETYTGQSWEEFFHHWLRSGDMSDWCVEDVDLQANAQGGCRATIVVHQQGEYTEQTSLGISLEGKTTFPIRIPILPQVQQLELDNPPAHVELLPENRVRIQVDLPSKPTQIAVDPDQILPDRNPANNFWKPMIRWRFTPLYTMLDETDITTAYDRWNVIVGPWAATTMFSDPWFTRASMIGVRAGLYRTQEFSGGVYAAYRTDYRDMAAGVDALWDHFPFSHTQVGFLAERSLFTVYSDKLNGRASLFSRYVFQYGDSLYLPPMHYAEAFAAVQDNALPTPREQAPDAEHFDQTTLAGMHYHLDYLTPYWDAVGGFRLDWTIAAGMGINQVHDSFERTDAQFSFVKELPENLGWLSETRLAGRVWGGVGLPNKGDYFTLGGEYRLRGFDFRERQGSLVWLGSLEWRIPLVRRMQKDCLDHTIGLRGINAVAFYDVGDAYTRNHSVGPVAHSVGTGLRFDLAWFSFVERSILRFDVAKAVNAGTATQFWFGLENPF